MGSGLDWATVFRTVVETRAGVPVLWRMEDYAYSMVCSSCILEYKERVGPGLTGLVLDNASMELTVME